MKNRWTVLYLVQKQATCLLTKFVPLSEIMVWGESEATHDVLLKKFDNLLSSDFGEWHHLDAFGEVISGYQQEPQVKLCSREWTTTSNPLCMKGQGRCKVWSSVLGLFDARANFLHCEHFFM